MNRLLRRSWIDLWGLWCIASLPCFFRYVLAIARNTRRILRLGKLVPADAEMAGRKWTFTVEGTRLTICGRQFSGVREMYARKVYFPIPEMHLHAGGTAIDLGANCGLFTILAGRLFDLVVAVEALDANIDRLRDNLELNQPTGRVELVHGLIGSGSGILSNPAVLRGQVDYRTEPIVVNMRGLMDRFSIREVGFLKVDIEGSEFSLFEGQPDWLDAVKKIAMEVHPAFGDSAQLVDSIRRNGYEVILLNRDQQRVAAIEAPAGTLVAFRR